MQVHSAEPNKENNYYSEEEENLLSDKEKDRPKN